MIFVVVIAESHGIKIHTPKDAYFSFFNSPYTGHTLGSAVDIYPNQLDWGYPVESPTTGRVIDIKKIRMGREKEFSTAEYDFGIALQPEGFDNDIIRILHVQPTIRVGDSIHQGDPIGTTLRSRYFNYWTGPHYHVEIMKGSSFKRSSQSYMLKMPFEYSPKKCNSTDSITEFEIKSVSKDNIIGYPLGFNQTIIGDFQGLSAIGQSGDIIGLLDGGLSHYKHGGVIGLIDAEVETAVSLEKTPIGILSKKMQGAWHFNTGPAVSPTLDGHELRGLSCFIYPKFFTSNQISQLILIPKHYGQFRGIFQEGDIAELNILRCNNRIKSN
ncbi:hypothetical protein EU527_12660 [Candidatus Thorarchaeota archaeon]|nr:MAG: hypothetical protein EU527_12660 [Candidatus Thorarchaeota archaeon]